MIVHIITHSRSNPVKAFFSSKEAKLYYNELKKDKYIPGTYGIISLEVEESKKKE